MMPIPNYNFSPSTPVDTTLEWSEFKGIDKSLVIAYGLTYLGTYIYNIINAINLTQKYNGQQIKTSWLDNLYFQTDLTSMTFGYALDY